MRRRCSSNETKSLGRLKMRKYYSERGISVCERWQLSFVAFLGDMGEAPDGLSLDRIDNDKGYYRDNCRWATRREQAWNTRATINICFMGQTKPAKVWMMEFGASPSSIWRRMRKGMTPLQALTQLYDSRKKRGLM